MPVNFKCKPYCPFVRMNDDSGFLVEALLSPNLWAMGSHKMMRIQENEFLIMVDWLLTCNFQVDGERTLKLCIL
nr:hypothetical protein Itr_chr14CG08600 [Ipomoea trifida]GMD78326.1 hypothetical protein Iba_chr13cCG11920 [Ipomoea batatas]GMD79469.1 hypothetical protein Iba_chr13dCG4190 [Ipomoea batatas]